MKYHYTKTKYDINVKYKDVNELNIPQSNRNLWTIYSIDNKYLALDYCNFCSEVFKSYKISKYHHYMFSFIQQTILLYDIMNKYNIEDCLIVGNRIYFLESLLYFKIGKIGVMPIYVDKDFVETYIYDLSIVHFKNKDKFKIVYDDTLNRYNNIIFYVSSNIFKKDVKEISIYNLFIYELSKTLNLLKKGGNLIFRILIGDNEQELNIYNIQVLYILSTSFEKIDYLHNDASAESPFLKNMCIFHNYNGTHNILDEIIYKLLEIQNTDENSILSNMIDVDYDDNYIKFIKQLNAKLNIYQPKLLEKYNEKKELIDFLFSNKFVTKFYDKFYKIFFYKSLNASIKLCENTNIEIINKYKTIDIQFRKKIENEILQLPKIKYYDTSYNILDTNNMGYSYKYLDKKFLISQGSYEIMKIYISLRDKKKILDIIEKISMSDYVVSYLSKSLKFIKIYELISNFKLIDTKKIIKSVHICENNSDTVLAINHYYKQYNNTDELIWKIYLKGNNKVISNKHLLFDNNDNYDISSDKTIRYITENYKNIDICTFDASKDEKNILITQIFICLLILKIGGNAIFKIYMSNIDETIAGYINVLNSYFEILYFSKSKVDYFESREIYIVAKNKNKNIDEQYFRQQLDHVSKKNIQYSMVDLSFLIYYPLILILKQEIRNLFVILYCYDNDTFDISVNKENKKKFIKKWLNIYGFHL